MTEPPVPPHRRVGRWRAGVVAVAMGAGYLWHAAVMAWPGLAPLVFVAAIVVLGALMGAIG